MPLRTPLRLLRQLRIAAALILPLTGCAGGDSTAPPPPPPTVASIRVTPANPSVEVGATVRLTAVTLAADGSVLTGRAVTWVSKDPTRATVSPDGEVSAIAAGTVRIAVLSGTAETSVTLTVEPQPASTIELNATSANMYEGTSWITRAIVRDARGAELPDRTVTWSSTAPEIASVDADGRVRAHMEGAAVITATHGTLSASSAVTVVGIFTADLLFDSYDGSGTTPRLFVAAASDVSGSPIFPAAGTWQASASPDGLRIAFACTDAPESPAICVANSDGTDVRVLTARDGMHEDEPAWSPDGRQIAFRRWQQGATPGQFNPTDIWVMNVDGSGQRNATADALVQGSPAWSPRPLAEHYRIAFTQESRTPEGYIVLQIMTMRADGGERTPLTDRGAYAESEPTWSPDGSQVLFVRSGGSYDGELVVHTLADGVERLLLRDRLPGAQESPAWSPDGRYIAFVSVHEASPNGNYRRQIYTVRPDGTALRRRTTGDVDKAHVAWLPRS